MGHPKLNQEKAQEIIRSFHYEKRGKREIDVMQDLAKRYDVSVITISKILNGKIWGKDKKLQHAK